jgi:hypothetical protein
MYGRTLKQAMRGIIEEADNLIRGTDGKRLKPGARNALVEKILLELWMRGYAVSARTMNDLYRDPASRDPEVHKAWRNSKLKLHPETTQSDVEEGKARTGETA